MGWGMCIRDGCMGLDKISGEFLKVANAFNRAEGALRFSAVAVDWRFTSLQRAISIPPPARISNKEVSPPTTTGFVVACLKRFKIGRSRFGTHPAGFDLAVGPTGSL